LIYWQKYIYCIAWQSKDKCKRSKKDI
jgi:hypothetical protein